MNKKLFNVLLFTAGATIGSLVTWKVLKKKYEQLLQEEIDSFKETYALCMSGTEADDNDTDDFCDTSDTEDEAFSESDMTEYATLAGKYGHPSSDENIEKGGGDDEVPYINGPYVIKPEEFGDGNYDHELHCLTYYDDGVLANDWWEKLDIDETIGQEALEHFGDYTEDVVHVRNERLQRDYEVTRDPRNYLDIVANDPLIKAYER